MHYILARLERAHPMSLGWRSLVKKVAITQGFVNPLVFLPLFYGWTGAVLGRSADETIEKVRKEGMDTLKATWVIFTPFNILNFSVIPVRHQAVSNAAFSLVYQTALSAIANAEAAAERRRLRDATDATATAAAECPR